MRTGLISPVNNTIKPDDQKMNRSEPYSKK